MFRFLGIGKEFFNGTVCLKNPFQGDRVQQDVLKSRDPAQVFRPIVHSVGVDMINNVLAGWRFPMKCRGDDPMDFMAPEVCVSRVGVFGPECPEIVEFAVASPGSFLAKDRTVVPNVENVPFKATSSGLVVSIDEKL